MNEDMYNTNNINSSMISRFQSSLDPISSNSSSRLEEDNDHYHYYCNSRPLQQQQPSLTDTEILDEVGWILDGDNSDSYGAIEPTPIGSCGRLVVVPEVSVHQDEKLRTSGIASDVIHLMNHHYSKVSSSSSSSSLPSSLDDDKDKTFAKNNKKNNKRSLESATATVPMNMRTINNTNNSTTTTTSDTMEDLFSLSSFDEFAGNEEEEEDSWFFFSEKQNIKRIKTNKTTSAPLPNNVSSSSSSSNNDNHNWQEESLSSSSSSGTHMVPATIASGTNSRNIQTKQWYMRYQDLLSFKAVNGHCCVPNVFVPNPQLAQWVKRQRYQYKLKQDGKHSTLSDERQLALEQIGFVWDSHSAAWMERFNELAAFRKKHGHANVPSNYPQNRQLSIWVKCQRRQYKLFQTERERSNMTQERIVRLESLDFVWNPRGL